MEKSGLKKLKKLVENFKDTEVIEFDFTRNGSSIEHCSMQISEEGFIEIDNFGDVFLTDGENVIYERIGDTAKLWFNYAFEEFKRIYENEIDEAKKEESYEDWLNYQDARSEMARGF